MVRKTVRILMHLLAELCVVVQGGTRLQLYMKAGKLLGGLVQIEVNLWGHRLGDDGQEGGSDSTRTPRCTIGSPQRIRPRLMRGGTRRAR